MEQNLMCLIWIVSILIAYFMATRNNTKVYIKMYTFYYAGYYSIVLIACILYTTHVYELCVLYTQLMCI